MRYNNLSKTFRYVNELGGEIIFTYDNGYLINKPIGIDTISVNLSRAHGINQIGDTIQAKNIQPRPVNISGIVTGGSKDKLLSVIRPDLNGRLYADDYFLDVHPTATPTISFEEEFAKFQLSLLAPYPYWQKKDGKQIALVGTTYKFKFPVNLSKAYRFGEYTDAKYITVLNASQVDVPFTIDFLAREECSNPKITNVITKEFLLLNKTLQKGERVQIKTTHSRTYVTSSIDGDIRGALDIDSNLFRLNVGDNSLSIDIEGVTLDKLETSITFAVEKVGVTV